MVTYKSTGAAGKIYRSTAEKKYLPAKMMYGENMASGYDAQTETGAELALLPDYNDGITKLRINGKTEQEGEPSPDNPSPMTDFTGGEVVCRGKNLLPYPYPHTTRTVNGITFTDNGDGNVTVNGTATANAVWYFYLNTKSLIGGLKIGDTITVSIFYDKTWTSSGIMSVVFNYYDAATVMKSGNCILYPDYSYKTITIGDDWVGIGFYIVVLKGQTVNNITLKAQVELGSSATEYTPYAALSSTRIQDTLRQVGDVYDYIEVSNGAVKKYQNIGTTTENVTDAKPNSAYLGTMTKNGTADEGGTITVKDGETVYYILSIPIVTDITDTETGQALLGMNTEYGKGKVLTITDSSMTVTQCKINTCSI